MNSRQFSLASALLGFLFTANYALGQPNDASAKARQAIQKIYNSPLYRSGTSKHSNSLRWPSSYRVNEHSFKWLRTIKKFALKDGKATVIVEYRDSVLATNPDTKKVVKFEALDTHADVWHKSKGKWTSSQSRDLTSDYLIDGKSRYFYPY